ncbi:MAG TPA: hypothetical protein EYO61_04360 [Campylobacterales bacterium]|nr:hypothetical protein [Campylobacterales bacterium]HIO70751.1 hypothetical protein [Campylobacterales bacterium]
MENITSSDKFVAITQRYIEDILNLLIERGEEFSIVTISQFINLSPNIPELFPKKDEHVRFDLAGYSFETLEIQDGKLVFQAGFGQGVNIKESRVTIDTIRILQIALLSDGSLLLANFSTPPHRKEEKKDRTKLFLEKNRGKLKK